jgi:hypothetical protein
VTAIAGFTKSAGIPGVADVFAAVAVCDIPVVSAAAFDSVVTDVLAAVNFLRVPDVNFIPAVFGVTSLLLLGFQ